MVFAFLSGLIRDPRDDVMFSLIRGGGGGYRNEGVPYWGPYLLFGDLYMGGGGVGFPSFRNPFVGF